MIGTLVNTGAIIAGSLAGMAVRSHLPEKMVKIVFQVIGLFALALGVSMSLASHNMILVIVSLVLGAVIGQWIDIDKYLNRFSDRLRRRGNRGGKTESSADSAGGFTEGFVTATMLFCVGSMSILGGIEDGVGQTPNILLTKSVMDGISSVVLASTFGIAILFSAVPVLLYQGAITIFATFMSRFMSETMIADLTSVGGIMLIGLGITILKIKEIKVTNMLPALLIIVLLSWLWG